MAVDRPGTALLLALCGFLRGAGALPRADTWLHVLEMPIRSRIRYPLEEHLMKPLSLCAVIFLLSMNSVAATLSLTTCLQPDIQAKIDLTADGDTLIVAKGDCTWNSILSLGTKSITLQGAGVGLTNITHNVSGSQVKLIEFTQGTTNGTRITGFSFLGGTYNRRFIGCNGSHQYTSAPMRIDNNRFISGTGSIQLDLFSCRGLVDHNIFYAVNNSELIHNWGPGFAGWSDDVTPGSTNALYVESNTFQNGSVGGWGTQSSIQSYDAARIVVRHNTFNGSQVDTHGGSNIGTRWFEFYENTFNTAYSSWEQSFDIRAGSGVIFNNHKTGVTNSLAIMLRYECRAGDAQYRVGEGIKRAHWSPVYIWGNDTSLPVAYSTGVECTSSSVTPGVNFITSNSAPANMKIQQKSTDTAGTTYIYSPFIYPYPLTANGMPDPSGSVLGVVLRAPTNLRML